MDGGISLCERVHLLYLFRLDPRGIVAKSGSQKRNPNALDVKRREFASIVTTTRLSLRHFSLEK